MKYSSLILLASLAAAESYVDISPTNMDQTKILADKNDSSSGSTGSSGGSSDNKINTPANNIINNTNFKNKLEIQFTKDIIGDIINYKAGSNLIFYYIPNDYVAGGVLGDIINYGSGINFIGLTAGGILSGRSQRNNSGQNIVALGNSFVARDAPLYEPAIYKNTRYDLEVLSSIDMIDTLDLKATSSNKKSKKNISTINSENFYSKNSNYLHPFTLVPDGTISTTTTTPSSSSSSMCNCTSSQNNCSNDCISADAARQNFQVLRFQDKAHDDRKLKIKSMPAGTPITTNQKVRVRLYLDPSTKNIILAESAFPQVSGSSATAKPRIGGRDAFYGNAYGDRIISAQLGSTYHIYPIFEGKDKASCAPSTTMAMAASVSTTGTTVSSSTIIANAAMVAGAAAASSGMADASDQDCNTFGPGTSGAFGGEHWGGDRNLHWLRSIKYQGHGGAEVDGNVAIFTLLNAAKSSNHGKDGKSVVAVPEFGRGYDVYRVKLKEVPTNEYGTQLSTKQISEQQKAAQSQTQTQSMVMMATVAQTTQTVAAAATTPPIPENCSTTSATSATASGMSSGMMMAGAGTSQNNCYTKEEQNDLDARGHTTYFLDGVTTAFDNATKLSSYSITLSNFGLFSANTSLASDRLIEFGNATNATSTNNAATSTATVTSDLAADTTNNATSAANAANDATNATRSDLSANTPTTWVKFNHGLISNKLLSITDYRYYTNEINIYSFYQSLSVGIDKLNAENNFLKGAYVSLGNAINYSNLSNNINSVNGVREGLRSGISNSITIGGYMSFIKDNFHFATEANAQTLISAINKLSQIKHGTDNGSSKLSLGLHINQSFGYEFAYKNIALLPELKLGYGALTNFSNLKQEANIPQLNDKDQQYGNFSLDSKESGLVHNISSHLNLHASAKLKDLITLEKDYNLELLTSTGLSYSHIFLPNLTLQSQNATTIESTSHNKGSFNLNIDLGIKTTTTILSLPTTLTAKLSGSYFGNLNNLYQISIYGIGKF